MTKLNVHQKNFKPLLAVILMLAMTACTHKPPTIAHTHIGHAITAFDGTPGEKGLFTVAEERAIEAVTQAEAAAREGNDLGEIKIYVQAVVEAYGSEDFGIKQAMNEAARHIEFAATSEDASSNVQRAAREVRTAADDVLNRCDLVILLGNDVLNTLSLNEGQLLAQKIRDLARINVDGGSAGEYGVKQIRTLIDEMIDAEDPAYVTVDRWYLFHLVRLPNCDTCWAWKKWANSSNRGY